MDVVTRSLLNEFSEANDLKNKSEAVRFEYFSNFCAVSQHFSDTFDVSQCSTGDFQGIDGIAVIVNGAFLDSPDTIAELVEANGYLFTTFIFVQAKTSSSFDLGEMSKFSDAVVGFFEDDSHFTGGADVKPFVELKNAVYEQSAKFKRGNPSVYMYYVTTGNWGEPAPMVANIRTTKKRLKALNILSEISYECIDAAHVQNWYRQTQNTRNVQINFERSVALPNIPKVEQAYLGALPASEFLKLLDDGSGGLVRSIFYENIRDYQRGSSVNEKIAATLTDGHGSEFVLRNNGVTVVAGALSRTGDSFTIKDYQIVNDCQTSNVIFDNKESLGTSTFIPVKIVVTNDEDVRSAVIISSNSQNRITDEQLWALEDFQKKLEAYFQAFSEDERLFYERRSRQYDSLSNVEKARIVTPNDLVRAYASMFLNEPHIAGRYYKELIGHISDGSMFGKDHREMPYYTAAFAAYRLAWLFRNRSFDTKFKIFRFHVLLALKVMTVGKESAPPNSGRIEKLCSPINAVLHSYESSEQKFSTAFTIVQKAVDDGGHAFLRDTARLQSFRDRVIENADLIYQASSAAAPVVLV